MKASHWIIALSLMSIFAAIFFFIYFGMNKPWKIIHPGRFVNLSGDKYLQTIVITEGITKRYLWRHGSDVITKSARVGLLEFDLSNEQLSEVHQENIPLKLHDSISNTSYSPLVDPAGILCLIPKEEGILGESISISVKDPLFNGSATRIISSRSGGFFLIRNSGLKIFRMKSGQIIDDSQSYSEGLTFVEKNVFDSERCWITDSGKYFVYLKKIEDDFAACVDLVNGKTRVFSLTSDAHMKYILDAEDANGAICFFVHYQPARPKKGFYRIIDINGTINVECPITNEQHIYAWDYANNRILMTNSNASTSDNSFEVNIYNYLSHDDKIIKLDYSHIKTK